MTQLDRRRIEAEFAAKLHEILSGDFGPEKALEIIGRASAREAFEMGRKLADSAPGNAPCLEHFSTVMDVWKAGGALDFVDVRLEKGVWSFCVVRCGYADMYVDMGLPAGLAYNVSCIRDEHLARGYSDRLRLERSKTIVQGAPACEFRFIWT